MNKKLILNISKITKNMFQDPLYGLQHCWTIMTHIITICTDHGVVVQINYVAKEIALLSFVIRSPRCINDRRSI